MAVGDVIVIIKLFTKVKGAILNDQDAFGEMPSTATDVRVTFLSQTDGPQENKVLVMCSGIATA